MAELKTNVDKKLMGKVAECFLQSVFDDSCLASGCNGDGFLEVTSGTLNPEGLYPFSLVDPIKLSLAGWVVDDYVKGNTCENIYKLVDATVPVTDPEIELYARDGQSLSGRWVNVSKAVGWDTTHPRYPYWDNTDVIDKFSNNLIQRVIFWDNLSYSSSCFNTLFTNSGSAIPILAPTATQLSSVTTTTQSGSVVIFRLGLAESSSNDVNSLYSLVLPAVLKAKALNVPVVMFTPTNSPQHLEETYKAISNDTGCLFMPSSIPDNSLTHPSMVGNIEYMDLRASYWLMNDILPKLLLEQMTMFSPDPNLISVTEIIKHLDIEMRTP